MKRTILPVVAALLAAFILPSQVFAQPFPRNTNYSRKFRSVIVGGFGNLMMSNARASVIAGGAGNSNGGSYSAVGGGDTQKASGDNVTIAGGGINTAGPGRGATIGGGLYNKAVGEYSTVPGGYQAEARHDGSFVWAADSVEVTESFGPRTFTVRCEGGARFYTANGTGAGVWLKAGLSSWDAVSDSNAKTKVTRADARDVLNKLVQLPVTEWEYKAAPERRFFGPMAQDFHAAFGLGNDDKTINTLDADGVLFLSVKGLAEELKERDREIEKLKTKSAEFEAKAVEVDALKAKFQALEQRLNALPPAP